ncbi:MAG TPA: flagellar basal body L-ring protein FlgH [Phycisphaerales bacterium]|nr:flagellar basal body L-ring protein FlgH [Phycisphaerales bacterium]
MNLRTVSRVLAGAVAIVLPTAALAQSLYELPVAPAASDRQRTGGGNSGGGGSSGGGGGGPSDGQPAIPESGPAPATVAAPGPVVAGPPPSLESVSLLSVRPPRPRQFNENDLITIIVSERNQFDRNQKLDTKKDYNNNIDVSDFLDLVNLLETRFQQSSPERLPKIGIKSKLDFKGDAKYKREDKATARVTAKVLEVKPNNTLVLEARSLFKTDEEEQVITMSGLCRAEDVTNTNTVQSNQLYDMNLNVQNKGQVFNTNNKGLIPRILETIFNF